MPIKLALYVNDDLHGRLSQRQGPGEALSRPLKRTLDRAFEMLEYKTRRLQGKLTVDEWKFLFSSLDSSLKLTEVTSVIGDGLLFSDLPNNPFLYSHGVLDIELNWVLLDVYERFFASGETEVTFEGMKKLGIMCKLEECPCPGGK